MSQFSRFLTSRMELHKFHIFIGQSSTRHHGCSITCAGMGCCAGEVRSSITTGTRTSREYSNPLSIWIEVRKHKEYRLVSNISRTSNIRRTPTLGNSQLEFSPTISLAKTSNTRCTPSFDFWVSIVDKVRSRPTWSELLRVAWDFDSPWITGSMAAHQSVAYVRHIILAPAVNLCTLSAIVFFSNKSMNVTPSPTIHRRQHHFVLTVKGPVWPRWPKISPCVTTKIMWNKAAFR